MQEAGFDIQVNCTVLYWYAYTLGKIIAIVFDFKVKVLGARQTAYKLTLFHLLSLQVCGYGHSSVYHGDNEYCTLSHIKNALQIFVHILNKFNQ